MGSTKKMYFYDNHIKAFSALILRIHKVNSHLEIVLDQTAFRPPTGGQDGDQGKIFNSSGSEAVVKEVKEKGDEIVHICTPVKGSFTEGESVNGEIDWSHRFALMQTHTGQHLFASALKKIGNENQTPISVTKVHIHPGFGDMFVDISKLDWNLFFKAETLVNEIISKNVPVSTSVLADWETLKKQYPSFRSGLSTTPPKGEVRVVEVEGLDVSTCTGSHLSNSNEVVVLKLLNVKKVKDHLKVEFAVGNEALEKTRRIFNKILPVSHEYSMGLEQIPNRLNHANQEIERLTRENKKIKNKLIPFLAQQILNTPQKLKHGN
ncbi:MAG: alanine--tRNA ligase-related protein, partial [Candidatus Ranarchaeia archaeon]